ncbi:MAG: PD-(D/E)XK nuclease family protein, partial [Muribaculaceae bacterium]|nr:PD-(D/E)XK nuclease family protein [Muribaculaceae bacterium]
SITVGKDKVEDYMAFSKDFKTLLEALIREIFDENIPIRQAEDENNCAYCQFKALCGRYPKDRSF